MYSNNNNNAFVDCFICKKKGVFFFPPLTLFCCKKYKKQEIHKQWPKIGYMNCSNQSTSRLPENNKRSSCVFIGIFFFNKLFKLCSYQRC